jgi:hypothetical protein
VHASFGTPIHLELAASTTDFQPPQIREAPEVGQVAAGLNSQLSGMVVDTNAAMAGDAA